MTHEKPCTDQNSSAIGTKLVEDEILETIWKIKEKENDVDMLLVVKTTGGEESLLKMKDDGLLKIIDGKVYLSEESSARARDITRRHLLAERLFVDVLDLQEYEEDACRFEHAISPSVEEAICTFLGHPTTCPHGRHIPKGECCRLFTKKVQPLVQSLKDIEVGRKVRVLLINAPAMDRLASIGLIPGAEIRLFQKKPSYVIGIDETTLAIDEDIAQGIFVKSVYQSSQDNR